MSVLRCIANLLEKGKITEREARDAEAIYRGVLSDDLLNQTDRASAEAYAATKTAEILMESARARKLELARSNAIYTENAARIAQHPNGPVAGYMGLFDRDVRNAAGDRVNVSSLEKEFYQPQLARKMHDFDSAYRSSMAGLKQDTTGVRNMIRELFGAKTGDGTAEAAAKGWNNAIEFATTKAKQFGRAFQTSDEWRLPQFWNAVRANKFGESEMRADIQREIDTGGLKVFDDDGREIAAGAERDAAVTKAIKDIRMDLGRKTGPGSVFKDEQRTFRFQPNRGADSYLRLMDKYGAGQGGYFAMMQGHAEKMARELALMHVFGPRFRGTSQALLDETTRLHAERGLEPDTRGLLQKTGDALMKPLESLTAAKRLQQYMTGQLSGAESELMAGIFQGTRSFLTATNMGSAIVTAIPADSVNWAMAANFRGLDGGRLLRAISDYFVADNPDKEAFATRLGITSHAVSRVALGTKQYGDQIFGGGALQTMKGLADTVVRAQGLHAWDTAINRAFTMEFLASIGDRLGKGFDELDPPFKSFMTDYGFNAGDWAKLSAGDHVAVGAAKFLTPDSLEEGVRAKLMSAIGDEKQFAYLAGGSNRVRAITTGGVKAGTLAGEMSRSFFLFKQFPMMLLATHGVRSVQRAANGQWGQIAALGLFMTMAGAMSLQAKDVLQGKDPRAMDDGDFWLQAALQGGAAGIYGDFLKDGFSRSDTSLLETAIGPMSEIGSAAGRLTSGAYREAQDGAKSNYGAELAKDVQKFTPGSTVWYTRLMANRFLFDHIRQQLDPDYAAAFQRERDRIAKDYGQDFYWQRGDNAPDRAPQLSHK